jgi:hypothetical protein
MSTVHLILQGKGGVGKIVHRGFTGQYLQEKGVAVRCFDADSVNCLSAPWERIPRVPGPLRSQNLVPLASAPVWPPDMIFRSIFVPNNALVCDFGNYFARAFGRYFAWSSFGQARVLAES